MAVVVSGSIRWNTFENMLKTITPLEIYNHWNAFGKNRLFGREINDPIAHVCQMNRILHDAGHSNIINTDGFVG